MTAKLPRSAIISGITLTPGDDQNTVTTDNGCVIRTVDRNDKEFRTGDGKLMMLYREPASGGIPLVDFPDDYFAGCEADRAELQSLYSCVSPKVSGESVEWSGKWNPPHQNVEILDAEAKLIKKLITAANYLGNYPILWI
jgi:hypothetical protein